MPKYEASSKHCPPYTARGTRCPRFSEAAAQELLDKSVLEGKKRYSTLNGLAFVGQRTHPDDKDVWHGYPEPWDRVPSSIKAAWLKNGLITKRDMKKWDSDVSDARKKFDDGH